VSHNTILISTATARLAVDYFQYRCLLIVLDLRHLSHCLSSQCRFRLSIWCLMWRTSNLCDSSEVERACSWKLTGTFTSKLGSAFQRIVRSTENNVLHHICFIDGSGHSILRQCCEMDASVCSAVTTSSVYQQSVEDEHIPCVQSDRFELILIIL
jgi:hypothetical protein